MGGKDKHSAWFRISLVILFLVIIGLTIGIIVLSVNRGGSNSEPSGDYNLPTELEGDNLTPEDKVTRDTSIMLNSPDVSMEEIEAYFDDVINKANEAGDYDFAIDIISQKMLFLVVNENDCEKARDYSDNIDMSMYSEDQKAYLQSNIYSTTWECDEAEETEWLGD